MSERVSGAKICTKACDKHLMILNHQLFVVSAALKQYDVWKSEQPTKPFDIATKFVGALNELGWDVRPIRRKKRASRA